MHNILIITYWAYSDALIQTYTLPYIRIIRGLLSPESKIFLVTLEKNVPHVDVKIKLETENINWISINYQPFGFKAFALWSLQCCRLLRLIQREKISTIHCWCTPPGAIGYVLSVITGKRLILDSYEPHAEAMVENGTWKRHGIAHRLLFWLEKKQTIRASTIISTTHGMRNYAERKYGVVIKNFYVKPACVDLNLFSLNKVKNPDILKKLYLKDKIVCVYAGKFGGIYLDQEVFDFLAVAAKYWGDLFRVLLLTNSLPSEIAKYCNRAGLDQNIIEIQFVSHADIPLYIGVADFALTPVKPVPSKRYCTPIKDGEYWALGLPVIIPANISDDSEIIETNNIGVVLYSFNNDSYFKAVKKIESLMSDPNIRLRIRAIAEKYRNFAVAEKIYEEIYDFE